jgi:hypothetical protein
MICEQEWSKKKMTDQNDTGGRNSVMEAESKVLCKSLVANEYRITDA